LRCHNLKHDKPHIYFTHKNVFSEPKRKEEKFAENHRLYRTRKRLDNERLGHRCGNWFLMQVWSTWEEICLKVFPKEMPFS
jgi:hypothetical protein